MTQKNYWLHIDAEPGTLKYALAVQKEIGGVVKFDGKRYWVDADDVGKKKENPDE